MVFYILILLVIDYIVQCYQTSDLGLTAQVGESPTKFEIWFRKCKAQDLYVLQAPSAEVKNAWVEEVTSLLWKQAERNRSNYLFKLSFIYMNAA